MAKTPVPQEHTENPLEPVLRRQVEELLAFFEYKSLPQQVHPVARAYRELASDLAGQTLWTFELVEALRLTLNARDAAIRSQMLDKRDRRPKATGAVDG